MRFYDAHNHLQDDRLAPHLDSILAGIQQAGIVRMVVNGSCEQDWPQVIALARRQPQVLPSFGYHPWYVHERTPDWQRELVRCLDAVPSAIGEIGLDKWILDHQPRTRSRDCGISLPMNPPTPSPSQEGNNSAGASCPAPLPGGAGGGFTGSKGENPFGSVVSPSNDLNGRSTALRSVAASLPEQEEVFVWQLRLAAERNVPVSIHCLQAWGPLLEILRREPRPQCGFVLHSYGGSAEMVAPLAKLGAYFSLPGYFAHERKHRQREAFLAVPPDRLLIETDAPDQLLPDELNRHPLVDAATGKALNHPANLAAVYGFAAGLFREPVEQLAARVEANFLRVFGA